MTTIETGTKVVDCDTHFWQPVELWKSYIDPQMRDRVLGLMGGGSGRADGVTAAVDRMDMDKLRAIKGGDDPLERLKWMDQEGMDVNIIFPGQGRVTTLQDPEVSAAACRALNRWTADFASTAPDRLKPCMVLPMRHPEKALGEFRYASDLGLGSVFVSPIPAPERRWSDPALDPVWAEVQDRNVVVAFHEFTGAPEGSHPVARPAYTFSYPFMYLCQHVVECQLAAMDMIVGGVLERFPRLRVGFIEASCAWLPGWLALMDSLWSWLSTSKKGPKGNRVLSLTATEYFHRQGFIAAFPDDAWILECVKYVGVESVVLSTDYPHPGTTYRMVDTFNRNYPDVPIHVRRKLLGGNAQRIFGLT